MPHGWAQAVFSKIEVFERAANKYSGGVNRVVERGLSIDQQNTEALTAKQPRALQPSQPRTDNQYVVLFHCSTNRKSDKLQLSCTQADSLPSMRPSTLPRK